MESQVLGMNELLKNLKTLPDKVQKRILVGAVRAGAKPIVKEARSLVATDSGDLKKSIGVTKFRTRKKSLVWFQVSPRTNGRYDGWYGRFLEFGTYANLDHPLAKPRAGKLGIRRAKIVAQGFGLKPRPFLRPAFEKEGENSIKSVKEYIAKRLDKELSK